MVAEREGSRPLGTFAVIWEAFVGLKRTSKEAVFGGDLWLRRRGLVVARVAKTTELGRA